MGMEMVVDYVKPELFVVAIALFCMGRIFKQSKSVKDEFIPALLAVVGVVLSALYVFAVTPVKSAQDAFLAVFTAIVQGVIVAGLAVYGNEIKKQYNKNKEA